MNSAIEQRNGRTLVGTVVSDKCDKTIVVLVAGILVLVISSFRCSRSTFVGVRSSPPTIP